MNHPKNNTRFKSLDKIAADPRVLEIWDESDTNGGLWISLADGYCCVEAGCVHMFNVKELIEDFKDNVVPCPDTCGNHRG